MNPNSHPHPKERIAHYPPATQRVRKVVKNWEGRTLRVQGSPELLSAYNALLPHEASLYQHSPHAPRLLTNLAKELTNRRLLPC